MAANQPNILFVMTDHQRADSLGMMQDGKEVTPNLNRLAERSTQFRRAYNTCPLCVPARTALATGLPPHVNGVIYNDWKGETAGHYPPLHQFLQQRGYHLGHVGVHHIRVSPPLEERVPFALWYSNPDYVRYLREQGLPPRERAGFTRECRELGHDGRWHVRSYSSTRTGVFPYGAEHFMDWCFAEAACRFLREAPEERPFALFVYFWAPHPPLIVPQPYASLF
ncbi:MAG: sulfatase-like hydrolase/transferase, partial [Armatimonadota bacterium]|nr:sulfatase-like hydrolase/transferase [Armatimonadota bacterium]